MRGLYTLIGFLFVASGCLLAKTNSTAILETAVDASGAIVAGATNYFHSYFSPPGAPPTPKNQLRQNQCGGMFSGPRRFCTRLIEFSKGVV
jgi:hypothetical protein